MGVYFCLYDNKFTHMFTPTPFTSVVHLSVVVEKAKCDDNCSNRKIEIFEIESDIVEEPAIHSDDNKGLEVDEDVDCSDTESFLEDLLNYRHTF